MIHHYNHEPALSVIDQGGLILFPSDTIWAIGCDATNEEAVKRVLTLKDWDYSQPLVILVSSLSQLKDYVPYIHPRVETLLAFHNQPLTIVFETATGIADNAKAKDGSAAFRIVKEDFCKQLIEKFGHPILGTSAHIGNNPYPKHFGEISSAVIQGVDYVVKHRQMDREMGPPSVIARLDENEELVFLRE